MVKTKIINGKVFKIVKHDGNTAKVSVPKEWVGKWVVVKLDEERI